MGPHLDLSLRRHQPAEPERLKEALRRPKMAKRDVERGVGRRKRNVEVDEMGDVRGRVHLGKQDLGKLQARKMKGLKDGGDGDGDVDGSDTDVEFDGDEDEDEETGPSSKRQKST